MQSSLLKLHKKQQKHGLELRFLKSAVCGVMFTFFGRHFLSFLKSFIVILCRGIISAGVKEYFPFFSMDFNMAAGACKRMDAGVEFLELRRKLK